MDMVAYNLVNQIEGNNKRAGAGAFTNTERDSIVKETRNRLYETARMSGSPQVDASPSSLFNYSHYNPFTNNITIKDYNDLIDEYGHSYKEYAENKSNVVDFLKSYIKKPWVNRKQQSKTYDTPGQLEFDVHQNVAPVLKNYVTYGGSTKDIQPTIEEFRRMDEEVENNNTTNQKALGGSLPASAYIGEGNFYGGGDIHENMKNGGIRVG
jgi:hypothetical protein